MNLLDAITRRQAELTQILAAFGMVDPGRALELVTNLRPSDLVDEPGRKFLMKLKSHTTEAERLNLAISLGLAVEFSAWMLIANDHLFDIEQAARSAADEIRALAITRRTLHDLAGWIAETAKYGAYHGTAA